MSCILLYEHLTGGGCWSDGIEPAGSLLTEGIAMRDALATDLALLPQFKSVHLLHDERLPTPSIDKQILHKVSGPGLEDVLFRELAEQQIPAILIAPELSGNLYRQAARFRSFDGQLLSPGPAIVDLCSGKTETCHHLQRHGVQTPAGVAMAKWPEQLDLQLFPAVLKPNVGCGSVGVQMIESAEEITAIDLSCEASADLRPIPAWRLERFCPGLPVSVAVLTGPLGAFPLQPCTQCLSDEGRFRYLGGATPIPEHLVARARRLAVAAAETLLPCTGYLGIDMVLGTAENGSQDVVIEINPRLTTSYLVLRQACEQNLAEAMLKWTAGEPVQLTWRPQRFEFKVPGN